MKSEEEHASLPAKKTQEPESEKVKDPPLVMSKNQRRLFEKMGVVLKVKRPESSPDETASAHEH